PAAEAAAVPVCLLARRGRRRLRAARRGRRALRRGPGHPGRAEAGPPAGAGDVAQLAAVVALRPARAVRPRRPLDLVAVGAGAAPAGGQRLHLAAGPGAALRPALARDPAPVS